MRLLSSLLLVVIACSATACREGRMTFVDPTGRKGALKEAQKKYTELIRWADFYRAAAYVDPELQAEFRKATKPFDDIRVTDYDMGEIEYAEDGTVNVIVSYHAYSTASFVEKNFKEEQEWYMASKLKNVWRVRSNLTELLLDVHVSAE